MKVKVTLELRDDDFNRSELSFYADLKSDCLHTVDGKLTPTIINGMTIEYMPEE